MVEFDYDECYLNKGADTTVFRIGNDVLKIYIRIMDQYRDKDREFRVLLSNLDTKRIVMPKKMIYKESRGRNHEKKYCGYTSTYIKPGGRPTNFIDTLKIYENFCVLEDDFKLLTKNNIIATDAHIDNLIFDDEENMFFVDVGSFYHTKYEWALEYANGNTLNDMLKSVIMGNSFIMDRETRIKIIDYLMEQIREYGALQFLEKDVCMYDTIGDFQKSLVKKLTR